MRQRLRSDSGASAVEFALILVPLFVIVIATIEFSFAFSRSQAMDSSSREAARLASIGAPAHDIGSRASEALATTFLDPNDVGGTIERLTPSGAVDELWLLELTRSGASPSYSYGVTVSGAAEAPCSGANSADSVRVSLAVEPPKVSAYAINLRLIPINLDQDFATEAVFRCEP